MAKSENEKRTRGRPHGTTAPRTGMVRQVRDVLGYSQGKLARELECTVAAIQTAERENRLFSKGEILERFRKLAKLAGVGMPE